MNKSSNLNKILYFFISLSFLIWFDLYYSEVLCKMSHNFRHLVYGINLNYLENTGAAFSILEDNNMFLIGFSIFAILLIFGYVIKNLKDIRMISIFWIALLIAGIGCNLYERIVFGFVRDYFQLTFVNFPVFNISDTFINISVIAIMILLINKKRTNQE